MPSSYTPLGLILQETGENETTWGDFLNNGGLSLIDDAIRARVAFALSGTKTLTSTNGVDTEGRKAILHATSGTGGTVTIPGYSKVYFVVNDTTGDLIITSGGSENATFETGESGVAVCDGAGTVLKLLSTDFGGSRITNVGSPTAASDAATKDYVDDTAFAGMTGTFPGQTGNAGKFLGTDGTTPAWSSPFPSQTGNAGEVLSTDGTNTLWLALGVALDVLTGTLTTPVTGDALYGSAAPTVLTDAATVAWDTNNGYNAYVVLGGNRTIGAPTNLRSGMTYTLELVQDATGSRVPTWASVWDWGSAGAPTLQTTANKADKVVAQYNARTSKLDANFRRGA